MSIPTVGSFLQQRQSQEWLSRYCYDAYPGTGTTVRKPSMMQRPGRCCASLYFKAEPPNTMRTRSLSQHVVLLILQNAKTAEKSSFSDHALCSSSPKAQGPGYHKYQSDPVTAELVEKPESNSQSFCVKGRMQSTLHLPALLFRKLLASLRQDQYRIMSCCFECVTFAGFPTFCPITFHLLFS